MNDKRLIVNPMSYTGIKRFPKEINLPHGFNPRTGLSNPSNCKMGNDIVTNEKTGKRELIKAPCHACKAAMRALEPLPYVPVRKRLTGRELTRAFFRP